MLLKVNFKYLQLLLIMVFVVYMCIQDMGEFIEYLKSFSRQLKYDSFSIIFFVFYHQLRNMVKHILYQILIHQQIQFHDEEFFLLGL
jgi:hypothetical protein